MNATVMRDWSSDNPRAWSPDELSAVHDRGLTVRQVAEMTGRSIRAVYRARQRWKITDAAKEKTTPHRYDPWVVGSRTLLARTCTECGLFLDASCFYGKNGESKEHQCCACRVHGSQSPESLAARLARLAQLQAETASRALRDREVYTSADMDVLADPSLTHLEKAQRLQRTLYAVSAAVTRFGFSSRWPSAEDKVRAGQTWQISAGAE